MNFHGARLAKASVVPAIILFSGIILGSPADVRTVLNAYLERLTGFGFSGSVLLARNDSILFLRGYGLADRENGHPFAPNTIFGVGSLTKQFTAAGVMRLVADGRINVNDSLGRFFKEAPPDKRVITLHHLLTHTSGFPLDVGRDYERTSRDTLLARAFVRPLLTAPGERHSYSNLGYSVLAAVIEVVSGERYDNFLKRRLFDPAGMRDTDNHFRPADRLRYAVGYVNGKTQGIAAAKSDSLGGDSWNLIGNAGAHSTLLDMKLWAAALRFAKVLPAWAVTEMMAPQVLVSRRYLGEDAPLYYGYGWYVLNRPMGQIVFHNGSGGVSYTSMRFYRRTGTILVYSSNVSEFADYGLFPALDWILDMRPVSLPPPVTSKLPPTEWAGAYSDASGQNALEIERSGAALWIVGRGQAAHSFASVRGWTTSPVFDSLNRRMSEFVAASHASDSGAFASFFDPPVTSAQIAQVEATFWQREERQLGSYIGSKVLGTRASRSGSFPATTVVRSDFAKGSAYREFIWSAKRTIQDYGPIAAPPGLRFFMTSMTCATAFEHSMAKVARICFSMPHAESAIVSDASMVQLRKQTSMDRP